MKLARLATIATGFEARHKGETMNDWSNSKRLGLIKAIVEKEIESPGALTEYQKQKVLDRILFLCSMPDGFLEANKEKYKYVLAEEK